jgi:hypothetical protein
MLSFPRRLSRGLSGLLGFAVAFLAFEPRGAFAVTDAPTLILSGLVDLIFKVVSLLFVPAVFILGGWKIAMNCIIYILGFDPLQDTGLPLLLNKDGKFGAYLNSRDSIRDFSKDSLFGVAGTLKTGKNVWGDYEDVDETTTFYVGRSASMEACVSFGKANMSILKDMSGALLWIVFAWTAVAIVKLFVAGVLDVGTDVFRPKH